MGPLVILISYLLLAVALLQCSPAVSLHKDELTADLHTCYH
jgi:hypothetical protein